MSFTTKTFKTNVGQTDLEQLIFKSLDMAKHLLLRQDGEFYPFGASVDKDGEYKNVGHFNGDDFPLSQTRINELKRQLEEEIEQGTIRSYAITFDCLAKKDETTEKTDAISIQYYSITNGQRTTYYYPYKIEAKDKIQIGEPWANVGH